MKKLSARFTKCISFIMAILIVLAVSAPVFAEDAAPVPEDSPHLAAEKAEEALVINTNTAISIGDVKDCMLYKNYAFDSERKGILIVPTPYNAVNGYVNLNTATLNLEKYAIKLGDYKYMGVTYMYKSTSPVDAVLSLDFTTLGGCLIAPKSDIKATEKLVAGEWTEAYIPLDAVTSGNTDPNGIFRQFFLSPYGRMNSKDIPEDDAFFVENIIFYPDDPTKPGTYHTVTFSKGEADTPLVGNAPEMKVVKHGEKITLSAPEIKADGYDFAEWRSDDGKFYKAGSEVFVTEDMYLEAKWLIKDTETSEKVVVPFSSILSVRSKTSVCTKETAENGAAVVKVVPSSDKTLANDSVYVEVNSNALADYDIQIQNYAYMGVKYKYFYVYPVDTSIISAFFSTGGRIIKSNYGVHSADKLSKNLDWNETVFDLKAVTKDNISLEPGTQFKQIRLYPFGNLKISEIPEFSEVCIGDITFYTEMPRYKNELTVSFDKGVISIMNDKKEKITVKNGERFTLPEPFWSCEGFEFVGWESNLTGKIYAAGEKQNCDGRDIVYTARWKDVKNYPEFTAAKYIDYYDNILRAKATATITETDLDNIACIKITPTPESGLTDAVAVDGYHYGSANINASLYKYAAIVSKYVSPSPKDNLCAKLTLSSNSALSQSVSVFADEKVKSGEWQIQLFNISGILDGYLTDSDDKSIVQIITYPYGDAKLNTLSSDDEMYLATLVFFKERPDLRMLGGYISGYSDSTFRPAGNMTRAEACAVVSRLDAGGDGLIPGFISSAYTDVSSDKWYSKYISYCESKDYLKSFTGTQFMPDRNITRAEFVDLVYTMGLSEDKGIVVSFSDVPKTHERFDAIDASARSGLVKGYSNGDGTFSFKPDAPITRAEVVTVLNNALLRTTSKEDISDDVLCLFKDVEKSYWAYGEIAQASLTHAQTGSKWICTLTNPASLLTGTLDEEYAKGAEYLKSLDKTTSERIAEIRNTGTYVEVTGKKYYVSFSEGNDNKDGLSPENAWKTIDKVNSASLQRGSGVFFKRGDTWRNVSLIAAEGVTYSAYGEGEKPRLYGSRENAANCDCWTLVYSDDSGKKIWRYSTEVCDVGTIIFDGGIAWSQRAAPNVTKDGRFVLSSDNITPFDYREHLTEDLMLFTDLKPEKEGTVPSPVTATGRLYLRCDKGNPGEVFSSAEINERRMIIEGGSRADITIDNLCIMYSGGHGIHTWDGTGPIQPIKNLTVTNCEIGWIGGSAQSFGLKGDIYTPIRFGNGVEIYGSCEGYVVDNCYIYQCYDCGATFQYGNTSKTSLGYFKNINYTNNVIEDCNYAVEAWCDIKEGTTSENILFDGNTFRRAGEGICSLRPNLGGAAHIKGFRKDNAFVNFVIKNNVFDRSVNYLIQLPSLFSSTLAIFDGNTYIQSQGGRLGVYGIQGGINYRYDAIVAKYINEELGDKKATVYFVK